MSAIGGAGGFTTNQSGRGGTRGGGRGRGSNRGRGGAASGVVGRIMPLSMSFVTRLSHAFDFSPAERKMMARFHVNMTVNASEGSDWTPVLTLTTSEGKAISWTQLQEMNAAANIAEQLEEEFLIRRQKWAALDARYTAGMAFPARKEELHKWYREIPLASLEALRGKETETVVTQTTTTSASMHSSVAATSGGASAAPSGAASSSAGPRT